MSIVTNKALGFIKDNGKNFDEKNKGTIKFLVDVKVVYIFTYIYVSVVNLISTTARTEALDDEDCNRTYNLSPLPEHTDVQVRLIGNAVLWSCRDESPTQYYYQLLYKMLFIVLAVALIGFFIAKLIALMTVLCNTKYALNKLWHLAIISELIQKVKADNKLDKDSAVANSDQQADNVNDGQNTNCSVGEQYHRSEQNTASTIAENIHSNATVNQQQHISDQITNTIRPNTNQCENGLGAIDKFDINCNPKTEEFCKHLFFQYLPDKVYEKCKWRSRLVMIIPIILLFLLVAALAISLLSYDLHPLGCLVGPEEHDIKYTAKKQKVEIDFPDSVQNFQIAAGFTVIFLGLLYLHLVLMFWKCSATISYHLLKCTVQKHIERKLDNFKKYSK